jgi:hypothetical protein
MLLERTRQPIEFSAAALCIFDFQKDLVLESTARLELLEAATLPGDEFQAQPLPLVQNKQTG